MPEGKRPLGSPRCRWEDNFKIEFPGMKWGAWIHLARDRDGWYPLFNTKNSGFQKMCRISRQTKKLSASQLTARTI